MQIEIEKVDKTDVRLPIKTYIVDTNERRLHSEPHIHNEIEIIYMMNGSMEFVVEDQQTVVNAGDIIIINSMTAHWSNKLNEEYSKMCLLQFNISLIYENNVHFNPYLASFIHKSNFKFNIMHVKDKPEYNRFADTLIKIAKEFKAKDTAYDIAIMSYIYMLFVIMYRENILKSTAESINRTDDHTLDRISEVLNHIQTNYGDSIKVKDVSEMLNINYSYFCRLFKKATGRTFIEYLNYYRISIAKKRLLQDKATVTEIILDTGFSSFSYFNRIFKRYTGFSPTTYRKLFGSEQSEAS